MKILLSHKQAIRDIHDGLSSETGSPVYTGFLASSWKVRRNPIDQTDAREDFEPWASIKREHDLPKGGEGWKPAGSRPDNPVIDPRFPVNTDYKFRDKDILIKFAKIDTEGNDTNVIKGFKKYLSKTKYLIFECSNCLDDIRGPGIKNPMKEIVDLLSEYGFNTYRIGTKKLFQVNDEHWNPIYEEVKFWSNCFALKKDDMIIKDLINQDFDYLF